MTTVKKNSTVKNVVTKKKNVSLDDLNAKISVGKGGRTSTLYKFYVDSQGNKITESVVTTDVKRKSRNFFRKRMEKYLGFFLPELKQWKESKKINPEMREYAEAWINDFYKEYYINNSFTVQSVADTEERQNLFSDFMKYMKAVNEA